MKQKHSFLIEVLKNIFAIQYTSKYLSNDLPIIVKELCAIKLVFKLSLNIFFLKIKLFFTWRNLIKKMHFPFLYGEYLLIRMYCRASFSTICTQCSGVIHNVIIKNTLNICLLLLMVY